MVANRELQSLGRRIRAADGKRRLVRVVLVCLVLCTASESQRIQDSDNHVRKLGALPSYRPVHSNLGSAAAAGDDNIISERNFVHGRALLATNTSWTFRPLAPRDDRLDPFDDFNHYRAGYDIKSKHYWGSVAFTGISGYAIAVAWLFLGLLVLFFVCCKSCFCGPKSRSKQPRSRAYHWVARVVVFLLSTAAVGCSVVLFVACKKFTAQAYNLEDVVVEAAQNATNTIHSVTDTLADVKGIVLPYNPGLYRSLNSTETKLSSLAVVVNNKVFVNKKTYQRIFKIIYSNFKIVWASCPSPPTFAGNPNFKIAETALLVVASVNLLLIVLGFASTFLKRKRFFYLIVVLTWIFIALTWVMFGFFLTVHYLADDTCLAFKQYLQNPQNTTLDDLLPCADLASSSTQYYQVRMSMKSVLTSATEQFLFYTDGATSLTGVCDPIGPAPDYKYTGVCANDTLPIGELSNLVKPFVCNGTRSDCLRTYPFYVNQSSYNGISAMTRASQSTLDAFPLLESLTNCSLVLNPINTVVNVRCAPAKVAIARIWIAFAVLSSVLILLLAFCCLACRRNAAAAHNYNFTRSSVTPQIPSPLPNNQPPRPILPK